MDRAKFDELMKKSESKSAKEIIEAVSGKPPSELSQILAESDQENESSSMQFGFDVVELQRVNLGPSDVLMVTVKNDDLDQNSVDALRNQLNQVFPNNKVFVFAMGTCDDVELKVISQSEIPVAKDCNTSYCDDCSCGKKEQAMDEHMKNLAKQALGETNERTNQ